MALEILGVFRPLALGLNVRIFSSLQIDAYLFYLNVNKKIFNKMV